MKICYDTAKEFLPCLGVVRVECVRDGKMKTREEINEIIFSEIEKILGV